MKFEREKNIAVFRGRNWWQKVALRQAAEERDPPAAGFSIRKCLFIGVGVPGRALNHVAIRTERRLSWVADADAPFLKDGMHGP